MKIVYYVLLCLGVLIWTGIIAFLSGDIRIFFVSTVLLVMISLLGFGGIHVVERELSDVYEKIINKK